MIAQVKNPSCDRWSFRSAPPPPLDACWIYTVCHPHSPVGYWDRKLCQPSSHLVQQRNVCTLWTLCKIYLKPYLWYKCHLTWTKCKLYTPFFISSENWSSLWFIHEGAKKQFSTPDKNFIHGGSCVYKYVYSYMHEDTHFSFSLTWEWECSEFVWLSCMKPYLWYFGWFIQMWPCVIILHVWEMWPCITKPPKCRQTWIFS